MVNDSLIDFNGISKSLGLLYTKSLGSRVLCSSYSHFLYNCFLIDFFAFGPIEYGFLNTFIWPVDGSLKGISTSGQIGPMGNCTRSLVLSIPM